MPTEHGTLQVRYDTLSSLNSKDPIPALGEPVLGTGPTPVLKFGDGSTHWKQLPAINGVDLTPVIDRIAALEAGGGGGGTVDLTPITDRLTADELNIDALIHRATSSEDRLNNIEAKPAPFVPLTQAEYDALATKDPAVLYVIKA